jgi:hypothetical protein
MCNETIKHWKDGGGYCDDKDDKEISPLQHSEEKNLREPSQEVDAKKKIVEKEVN